MFSRLLAIPLALCCLLLSGRALADTIHVAVASNFAVAMGQLAESYRERTGHEFRISAASTGKLFAQIRHGAPFHLFFAADARRPKLLAESGDAVAGSLSTYAVGRLVLWQTMGAGDSDGGQQKGAPGAVDCPDAAVSQSGARALRDNEAVSCSRDVITRILTNTTGPLAMANPKTAPYGKAAEETLRALGLWEGLQSRLVRGENIGQTYQFVVSGAAPLGFVALSQVRGRASRNGYVALHNPPKGKVEWLGTSAASPRYFRDNPSGKESFRTVPESLHAPLHQQVVLLQSAREHAAARGFLAFLRSAPAREIIQSQGYGL